MKIVKSKANQQLCAFREGIIEGKSVKKNCKFVSEVAEIYENAKVAEQLGEKVAYTVYSYTDGDESRQGNLFWGLSVLEPLQVDGECNMTRGHFHENRDCAEIYFGLEGNGLLMLMSEDGDTWAEIVEPGSIHHIDGHAAHRLINTGTKKLKVGACWPTTAGHDYEALEAKPFGYRIYKEADGIRCKKSEK